MVNNTRLRLAGAAAAVAVAVLAPGAAQATGGRTPADSAATPTGTAPGRPALPAPTSRYPVGSGSLHLVDASRADPWVPSSGARQLMVRMWYPTRHHGRPARYVTPEESERILTGSGAEGAAPDALARVRTHHTAGGVPLRGRHPLVVLSPGFSLPAGSLTGLAEDLASHGYVVAGIDHNYESWATRFPDGRITTCVACVRGQDPARVVTGRVADVSFVLDRLTGPRPAWRYADRIDASRVAMVGHSIGGASASAVMVADRRVDAGVNLDGTPYQPPPETGLSRPFMLFGTGSDHAPGGDEKWDTAWTRLTGWRRWFSVTDAVHFTFTDYAPIADQVGISLTLPGLTGARSMDVTRAYVLAFVEEHLRGRAEPLLDGPSPRFPEVTPQP